MKTLHFIGSATIALLLGTSCSGNDGWSIRGKVDGLADGQKLALEANNGSSWYVVDSIEPRSEGKFTYESQTPALYGDIMRLTLPGKGSVYFPVDSVDAITLTAAADNFGTGHTLAGTSKAQCFSSIDSIVANTADIDDIQRKLIGFITSDTTGIVSYYAINKAKGNSPVFNPKEYNGNRAYGAAAQVFATYQPQDRRGEALKKAFLEGRIAMGRINPVQNVIEVPESGLIDIVRFDNKGMEHSLTKLAEKKGVIVLSFTDYSNASSPAYNALLYDIYNKYHGNGLEIYQLSFDADEVSWKQAADNLPWITVWNAPTDGAGVLMQYNVGAVPLTYVIGRDGEIKERISNPANIEKTVQKYL